jgi:hypothetical protein
VRTLNLALLHQDWRIGIFHGFVGTQVYTNKSVFAIIIFDQQSYVNFIYSIVRLTTGPQPLPKRVLHPIWSSAFSFHLQHPLFSSRSSSSCFRLLPPLPVTYIFTFIIPSTKCFRRQFLRKMWPIQLSFIPFIVCRKLFSSLNHRNTSSFLTWLVQLIVFSLLQHHISNLYRYFRTTFRSVQVTSQSKPILQMQHFTNFSLKFKSYFLVNRSCLLKDVLTHGNLWFNFPCEICNICYHVTQIVEIFHILVLFLIYLNPYWECYTN